MVASGMALRAAGAAEGISGERVRQILNRAERSAAPSSPKAPPGPRHSKNYAMSRDEFSAVPARLRKAFHVQRMNAAKRGIQWDMTLAQWLAVWEASGHLHERGKGAGKYCMSRNGDAGPYRVDNVCIKTNKENLSEGFGFRSKA